MIPDLTDDPTPACPCAYHEDRACVRQGETLLHAFRYSATTTDMERDHAITTLKAHQAELQALGVEGLFLFGSTARGKAHEDSDVDLFFDYQEGKFGLFELMDVQEHVSRILGRRADVMTRDSIHKVLRRRIEATALRVF